MKKRMLFTLVLILCCLIWLAACDGETADPNETEETTAHEHTVVQDEAVSPTCTEKGKTAGEHCSVCNEILVAQTEIDALGHDPSSEWTVDIAPTCTESGIKSNHCTRCSEKLNVKTVYPISHTYATTVVPPTATTDGYTEHTCTCGNSYRDLFIPAFNADYLSYKVNSDKTTCTVTGFSNKTYAEIVIPEVLDGYTVTAIAANAFYAKTDLISVKIANSVTRIGVDAFKGCTALIQEENGVYYVDKWVVGRTLPAYVNDHLTLRADTVGIAEEALMGCGSLHTITIPDSVRYIGSAAFKYCLDLEAVYITDLEAWCTIEFASPDANPLYYAHNLYLNNEPMTDLTIPDGMEVIRNAAFYGCTTLKRVTIPNGVTAVGESAFCACTGITSVTIGKDVASIGDHAFEDCGSLTGIEFAEDGTLVSIGDYAFHDCRSLPSVTIPDGVESIGEHAFWRCDGLTSITIPASVTSIGIRAFVECSSIERVYVNDLAAWCAIQFADVVANPLFYSDSLYINGALATELIIPNGVTSIGNFAFYGYTTLEKVTLPDGVTSIGDSAFYNCRNLPSIKIPDSVTSIGERAFVHCYELASVTGCNGLTSIGNSAFSFCEALTSINLPDCLRSIGDSAFYNCSMLENVTLGSNLTTIGVFAFCGCESITSISIPASVTSIGESAFYGCSMLENVTLGSNLTTIGASAFRGCESITSISIPASVTSIGEKAFSDCSSLTYTIYDNGKYLGNSENPYFALIDVVDTRATSLAISNDTRIIGGSALNGCTLLASVTGGDRVTHIGDAAFKGCGSLENFVFSDSVTSIGNSAFEACALKSITISASVTSIGASAFDNCDLMIAVYYMGTAAEWNNITIESHNTALLEVARFYYSETSPTASGRYWHYVDGVPTKW